MIRYEEFSSESQGTENLGKPCGVYEVNSKKRTRFNGGRSRTRTLDPHGVNVML